MYETIDIGGAFLGMGIGLGSFILLGVIAYMMYCFSRIFKYMGDYEERMTTFEIAILDKLAKEKGIDLRKEIEQNKLLVNRSFRKRIRDQMYEEMFSKDKEEK